MMVSYLMHTSPGLDTGPRFPVSMPPSNTATVKRSLGWKFPLSLSSGANFFPGHLPTEPLVHQQPPSRDQSLGFKANLNKEQNTCEAPHSENEDFQTWVIPPQGHKEGASWQNWESLRGSSIPSEWRESSGGLLSGRGEQVVEASRDTGKVTGRKSLD